MTSRSILTGHTLLISTMAEGLSHIADFFLAGFMFELAVTLRYLDIYVRV